ncbi:MAG: NAD(P)-dependent alcohol dehydrogenase [Nakamurella sp.]
MRTTMEHPSAALVPEVDIRTLIQRGYGDATVLSLQERSAPIAGPGEVLIRVAGAAIDRGTWHITTGLPRMARLGLGLRRPKAEVPGLDVAGTVVGLGAGVTRFALGDRVFGIARGSLTECAVALESKLARVPQACPVADAAALGVSGSTALQALDAARVGPGSRVLVIGASGGVGHFAVQIAAGRGAQVTAVCSGSKREAVLGFGASTVLVRERDDLELLTERFDAIVDMAATRSYRQLRRLLADQGRYVFVGAETGGPWTGGFLRPARAALRYRWSAKPFVMLIARERAAELETLAALVDEGILTPHIDARYRLDEVGEALDRLVSGLVVGKVCIAIGDS